MKANAPEKIFRTTTYLNKGGQTVWKEQPVAGAENIEYTRTDAFIDKACKWLEDNLYDYAGNDDKRNIVPFDKSIFEDFKNYMEQ